MRKFYLFLLVSSCLFRSLAETPERYEHKVDSIKRLLMNVGSDSRMRCRLLLEAGRAEMEWDSYDANAYGLEALNLAVQIDDRKLQAESSRLLGEVAEITGMLDSAEYWLNRAIDLYDPQVNKVEIAKAKGRIGILYENRTNYTRAYGYYLEALKLFESVNDKRGIASQYLNLGLINQYLRKPDVALKYFNRSLSMAKQYGYPDIEASALNNIGIQYQNGKQLQQALPYFKQVLALDLQTGDQRNIAYSYNNLGNIYCDLNNLKEALFYLKKAAELKESLRDFVGLTSTYNNLASVYTRQGNWKEAEKYLARSEKISLENGIRSFLYDTYFRYYEFYKSQRQYEQALHYYQRYAETKDTITLTEKDLAIEKLQKQYDFEKMSKEVNAKDEQILRERKTQLLFVILILFLGAACVFFVLNSRKIRKMNLLFGAQEAEIRQQNEVLRQKNIDIVKAKQHAEEAAKSKGQFLSVMSHEIKTPLNAIIGIANLMATSGSQEDLTKNIGVLKSSADNLMALINDILDISKIESGKMHVEYVDFNLREVVQNLHNLFLANASAKGLRLVLNYDPALNQNLLGDPLRINQILSNLLSNAIKFTEHGEVRFKVQKISEGKDYFDIRFEVTDTGIGIPEEKQSVIFESFEQANKETTRKYGGTGLGLSISKQLLEMLGSQLLLKSSAGKGATFYFTIRFNKIHSETDDLTLVNNEKTLEQLKGKRVLVAEDNPVNIYILRQFLGKWDVQVKVADDGIKAVEMALQYNFDIILMDINMPVLDGYEASKRILAEKPNIPIIAITATTLSETTAKMKESGIVDYVPKPFQPNELVEKLLRNLRT